MLKNLTKILGGSNEKVIKSLQSQVDLINSFEPRYKGMPEEELRQSKETYGKRFENGETLNELLPEVFAAVREASWRTLRMRHFDVQLMGGIVLHDGKISEMRTGEGKTLVATLPSFLNCLSGKGVHVVTVNDYLAGRDAQWMGQVYHYMGASVGVLQHDAAYVYDPSANNTTTGLENLRPVTREEAYASDITYGTNNEFGFDYLRDNMVVDAEKRSQQNRRGYAIVDEVDNILIDEARTPLIISGPSQESPQEYQQYARVVKNLRQDEDYSIDEKHRSVALSNDGITKLERMLNVDNIYDPSNIQMAHFVENALKANAVFQKDREYVVQDGNVVIVDEFTGRLMGGRRYSDGLHQAIEAKEGVKVQKESVTYATITLQNYFRLYDKLAGMTGTANTEAEEFWKIYKLEVVEIPTNKPMVRDDRRDLIYKDQDAKYKAVVKDIKEHHENGQPVLVGTTDIDLSEKLSAMLNREGVSHEVLNAKQHNREAIIIAQAGRPGAVTVATNMAGRGTDIILGGNPEALDVSMEQWQEDHDRILDMGGLFIIGTERHEARRIDNQLRGRSGRQGDPGATRFYVALDDQLMRRFGGDSIKRFMDWALEEDTPIESKAISKAIENAQVKTEGHHFDMRKHLVEYDDVVNAQRDIIYKEREKILDGVDMKLSMQGMVGEAISDILRYHISGNVPERWDIDSLLIELEGVLPLPADLKDPDDLRNFSYEEIEDMVLRHAEELYDRLEGSLGPEEMRALERHIMLRVFDSNWVQHLTTIENLRQGVGLHAYGQRDPLVMYKKEGHEKFQELQVRIRKDVTQTVYRLGTMIHEGSTVSAGTNTQKTKNIRSAAKGRSVMENVSQTKSTSSSSQGYKVGRNAPCPCGSGKKYKRCHG